ncbi:MAG: LysR family transcriptional regulator [Myxococcota bacterium]
MHEIESTELAALDLNLLVVLSSLLDTSSVTETSRRIHRSPSAVSHALRRLRETLRDPLFIRSGRRLVPTSRASDLAPRVREAIEAVARVFAPPDAYDPTTSEHSFVIAIPDLAASILPYIGQRIRELAPSVGLSFRLPGPNWVRELETGELDLMLGGTIEGEGQELMTKGLGTVRFVVVGRRGHPAGPGPLDLTSWLGWPHVLVFTGDGAPNQLGRIVEQHGLERRVALGVPSMLAALHATRTSNWFFVAPRELVGDVVTAFGLQTWELPIAVPPIPVAAFWAPRRHDDPALRWLRGTVQTLMSEVLTQP